VPLLIGVLFLMGTQSAFFGPVKYGILPQHLREEELVGGNGLVEMGTFLAILLGTMAGGILIGFGSVGALMVAGTVVIVAVLGYMASRGIPVAAATDPELRINWNPLTETWRNLRFLRENRTVFLSILGISWFWFFGATYLAQLPGYTKDTLGGNEQVVTVLLTLFSVGIGIGSLLCERLSDRKVELGLVPFGAIGLTVFSADLYFAYVPQAASELIGAAAFLGSPGAWRVAADVVLLGMFGGFYIVPLYALIQIRSEPSRRSRIIAGNNIVNALFMVLSAIYAIVLLGAGLSVPELFLITAVLNALVAIYIFTLVPEFFMRFMVWIFIAIMYRVQKQGLERIPDEGAAVLVCNHVSSVGPLVLTGCCRRPMRFVMHYKIYQIPVLNFIFRTAGAIPIASTREDPDMLRRAYDEVDAALKAGELVCLFPEGKLTDDGEIKRFRRGIEEIVGRTPVPVVPVALRGLWGSAFSRQRGGFMSYLPRRLWAKIGLAVGEPVAPEVATASALQDAVLKLRGDWK
jgi:1-acyl-sn-glycerol-3-phosphate acyltransferase